MEGGVGGDERHVAVAAALRMEKQIGRSCVKILSKHVVRPHIRPSAPDTQRWSARY